MKLPERLSLSLIRFYQRNLADSMNAKCIFKPTCSEYTRMAIEKYGAIKGWRLGLRRIARCRRPHGKGGVDFP